MLAKYEVKNVPALMRIVSGGTRLSYWSKRILDAMHKATCEFLKDEAATNPVFAGVH